MQRKRQGLRNPVNLTIDSVADVRAPPQPLALSHPSLEGQDETTLETNPDACIRRAERNKRLEMALSKTDVTILRLLLPHNGDSFSSLVFATVAHSAPSLGAERRTRKIYLVVLLRAVGVSVHGQSAESRNLNKGLR